MSTEITPTPTDEEAAALVAAVDALWPRPVVAAVEQRAREAAWRFSGRWWAKPLPQRRDRPFR
jgi:transposase